MTSSIACNYLERQAVLAFIEYLQVLQEELADKRNSHYIPFDTGNYKVSRDDIAGAIYFLAFLIKEAVRKKSMTRIGRKLMEASGIKDMLTNISPCFGTSNIVGALPQMFYDRPSGFLDPLNDAEWHRLSEKALAEILARGGFPGKRGQETTSFSSSYFTLGMSYTLTTKEALQKAEEIVASEKVRLNLFLEALQGTLRFLDRLSRFPQYQELQLPVNLQAARTIVARDLITFLSSLLSGDFSVQEEQIQNSEQEIRIVESDLALSTTVTLQVRKEEHTGDLHTYYLTLTDNRHLVGSIPFPLKTW